MSRVEESDPEGIDYGWVMQVTFVLTVLVGAPLVAALSVTRALPTWESRVTFAVRVGAVVWILTALSVYAYARREHSGDDPSPDGDGIDGTDSDAGDPDDEAGVDADQEDGDGVGRVQEAGDGIDGDQEDGDGLDSDPSTRDA